MSKGVYRLKYTLKAIDLKKSNQINRPVTKLFQKGQEVIAEGLQDDCSIVDDRYVIPDDYLEKISESASRLKKNSSFAETHKRISEQTAEISEREREKQEQLEEHIKNGVQGELEKKTRKAAKVYRSGAVIGLAAGILLALKFKKNALILGGVGLAAGGYVANQLHKSSQGNNPMPKKA